MERENHLAQNLMEIRKMLHYKSLAEIANETQISKSTLQDAMKSGNVTLDTAIRIANAFHISLDTLVFGPITADQTDSMCSILRKFSWYSHLLPDEQEQFRFHLTALLDLLKHEN